MLQLGHSPLPTGLPTGLLASLTFDYSSECNQILTKRQQPAKEQLSQLLVSIAY
jgi:hypothetical protein